MHQGQTSEEVAVLNTIPPQAIAGTEVLSVATRWFPLGKFKNYMGVGIVALLTDTDTLDFSIRGATDSSGAGDTSVVASTQITGSSTTNKQIVLACNEAQILAAMPTATHVGMRMISSADQVGIIGAVLLGSNPQYGPAHNYDGAGVIEVKTAT